MSEDKGKRNGGDKPETAEDVSAQEPAAADTEETASPEGENPRLKMSEGLEKALADAEAGVSEASYEPSVAAAPEGDEKNVASLSMSDELKAALEEAEGHLSRKPGTDKAAPEEIDIDIDEPVEEPDADEAEQKEFDPNVVESADEKAAPSPPSAKELKLKTEILDLRHKLRNAEQEIEKKIKEVKQNREQAKHIQSQFESYKMRIQKEKADVFNYGHEPILKEMLAVVDNLERAIEHAADDADAAAIREGVELTLRQFKAILNKFGVAPIEPKGEQFNPEFHQAMMQVEDGNVPANTVVDVQQKGYLLKDRLLRPAMVVVSKGGEAKKAESAPGPETESSSGPEAKKEDGDSGPAGPEGADEHEEKKDEDGNN
jgi:molecular chaperone GrpE